MLAKISASLAILPPRGCCDLISGVSRPKMMCRSSETAWNARVTLFISL